jgi:hypothetical protein
LEFMARLAALIAPPRYPLLRYAGVLGPRSAWRKDIVPKPRERRPACSDARDEASGLVKQHTEPKKAAASRQRTERSSEAAGSARQAHGGEAVVPQPGVMPPAPHVPAMVAGPGDVVALTPNVLSVKHWDRLLGGALYAATPRVDWAALLHRSFQVDVMECAKCGGRLRVLAVIAEREPVQRILAHLGVPSDTPPLARARDPSDDLEDAEPSGQLGLGLA